MHLFQELEIDLVRVLVGEQCRTESDEWICNERARLVYDMYDFVHNMPKQLPRWNVLATYVHEAMDWGNKEIREICND